MSGTDTGRLRRSITPASLRKLADAWACEPEFSSRSAAIKQLRALAETLEARG